MEIHHALLLQLLAFALNYVEHVSKYEKSRFSTRQIYTDTQIRGDSVAWRFIMKRCPDTYNCPVEATLDRIGGKYKSLILWHLMIDGILRFSELNRKIPLATQKMLAQQLRDLEADGLIIRTAYPVVPPKVEYTLSEVGKSLTPILQAMYQWGRDYLKK